MVSARLAVLAVAAASIFNGVCALPQAMDKRMATVTQVVRPVVKVFVVVDQDGNTISYSRSTVQPDATPSPKPRRRKSKTSATTTTTPPAPALDIVETSAPAPAQTSQSSGGSTDPAPVVDGKLGLGIVYSPYHDNGLCKDTTTVESEIAAIAASGGGYNWLRIYGVDCNQVANVVTAAWNHQLKVMLGIYNVQDDAAFNADLSSLVSQVKTAMTATGKKDWSGIAFISVGNEVVNQNQGNAEATVSKLLSYAAITRKTVQAEGYTGSVGNTDVWIWYKTYPQLCGEDNLVMINMHPFFDGNCDVASSGAFLKTHLAEIQAACGADKQVIISETGWPNAGDAIGVAIPGQPEQAQFLQLAASNLDTYMLLTAYDEGWKPATPSVERHWGILGTSPSH